MKCWVRERFLMLMTNYNPKIIPIEDIVREVLLKIKIFNNLYLFNRVESEKNDKGKK